jgi:phenylacetic acid degradation operon negative regulatory protein
MSEPVTPTARSLILDLLSTLRRGTMPVGALVEAGALFGIAGNNVRVALTRLLEGGFVVRDQRGAYRLGAGAEAVERRVRSWRDLDRSVRTWQAGAWLAVQHVASAVRARSAPERGRERALRMFGFRELAPGLAVRPDNLRDDVADLRREIRALGLPDSDLLFALRALDPEREDAARGLWDVDGLCASYRARLAEIEASEARLGDLGAEEAMVETFLLGGAIIRELVLDPLLPEAICPSEDRRALAVALRRYDKLGRSAWAGFLKRFDVPHIRTPLDGHQSLAQARLAV